MIQTNKIPTSSYNVSKSRRSFKNASKRGLIKPPPPVPVELKPSVPVSDCFIQPVPDPDDSTIARTNRVGVNRRFVNHYIKGKLNKLKSTLSEKVVVPRDEHELPHIRVPHTHHFISPCSPSPSLVVPQPQQEEDMTDFEDYSLTEEPCGSVDYGISQGCVSVPEAPPPPVVEEMADLPPSHPELQFSSLIDACPISSVTINLAFLFGTIDSTQALKVALSSFPTIACGDGCNTCEFCSDVVACRHTVCSPEGSLDPACSLHDIARVYAVTVKHGCGLLSVVGNPVQTATPFEFLSSLLQSPIRQIGDDTPDSFYIWAAVRALRIFTLDWSCAPIVLQLENYFAKKVQFDLPIAGVPQSIVMDLFAHVTTVLSSAWAAVNCLPEFSARLFKRMQSYFVAKALQAAVGANTITDIISQALSSVVDELSSSAKSAGKKMFDSFLSSGMCGLFIKTIVRLFMKYSPMQICLEILWDSSFIDIAKAGSSVLARIIIGPTMTDEDLSLDFIDDGVAQSPDAPVLLIISALTLSAMQTFGSPVQLPFSTDKFNLVSINKMLTNASSLLSSGDKLGFGAYMRDFQDFLMSEDAKDREFKRWQMEFPNTVKLVDCFAEAMKAASVSPTLCHELRYYYGRYLVESAKFGDDRPRITAYASAAVRYVVDKGESVITATRLEPSFFLISGPPGMGKSVLAKMMATAVAKARLHTKTTTSIRSISDLIYNVNPCDSYASGYAGQGIWFYDDWLQRNDSEHDPSIDISLMFTLITAQPMSLNMAAVSDKGLKANCELVVGATNVPFWQQDKFRPDALTPHVKSVQDVGAVRRRIKYIVVPFVRHPYVYRKDAGLITNAEGKVLNADSLVDPQVLFRFRLFDSANQPVFRHEDDPYWDWQDLLRLAYNDYMKAVEFVPSEGDDSSWKFLVQERGSEGGSLDGVCQGLNDLTFDYEIEDSAGDSPRVDDDDSPSPPSPLPEDTEFPLPVAVYAHPTPSLVAKGCKCGREGIVYSFKCDERCFAAAGLQRFPQASVFQTYEEGTVGEDDEFVHIGVKGPACFVAIQYCNDEELQIASKWKLPLIQKMEPETLAAIMKNPQCDTFMFVSPSKSFYFTVGSYSYRFVKDRKYLVMGVSTAAAINHQPLVSRAAFGAVVAGVVGVAVVAYALSGVASKLADAAVRVGHYAGECIKSGYDYFTYDADQDAYTATAQAPNIVISGGRRFVMVKLRTGAYRLYPEETWIPQGEENVFSKKFSRNQRFNDQFPQVANNLWAVVKRDNGVLCGSVLAINETTCLTPLHVAYSMMENAVFLKKDETIISITNGVPQETSITIDRIGSDLAIIHFFNERFPSFKLPNAKTMLKKFCCSSSSGVPLNCASIIAYRLADGSLRAEECVVSPQNATIGYMHAGREYAVKTKNTRATTFGGLSGACGGVYLFNGEANTELILGMHVCYLPSKRVSAMHTIQPKHLTRMRSIQPGTSFASEDVSHSKGYGSVVGLPSAHYQFTPSYPRQGKRGETNFEDGTDCKYVLAPLAPFASGSGIIDPTLRNLENIAASARAPKTVTRSLEGAVGHVLRHYNTLENAPRPKPLLSFKKVVTAESGLPHIDLSAASGEPFRELSPSKRVLFGPDGRLLDDAVEFLEEMEEKLVPNDWATRLAEDFDEVDCICTSCCKDEPRPLEKAVLGKTRLFTVCPVQEFIMQRKYFLDFSLMLTDVNLAVYSALGLGPNDYGAIHMNTDQTRSVMTGDFSKFDQSFTKRIIRNAAKVILLWYGNEGLDKREVDPDLPPLDKENFMRYRLIERLAHFKVLIGDEVLQYGVTHPSGSFLTTILNVVAQSILWTDVFQRYIGDDFNQYVDMTFLGDDSFVSCRSDKCPDVSLIINAMAENGFTITSDIKEQQLSWRCAAKLSPGTHSEYKFLSRYFGRIANSAPDSAEGVWGLLEPERLLKMLHFSDLKKMQENFPSQVLMFVQEVKMWHEVDPLSPIIDRASKVLQPFGENFLYKAMCLPPDRLQLVVGLWLSENPSKWFVRPPKDMCEYGVAQGDSNAETTFVGIEEKETEAPFVLSSDGINDNMDAPLHDLSTIFERPFRVQQLNWKKTDANGTKLHAANYPSKYFDLNFNAQAKLANYSALRGVVCVKVSVSGSPFAQGLGLLSARPLGRDSATEYEAMGDPSVIVDVASGTSAVIKIPTVLPQGWSLIEEYNNDNSLFDWVRVSFTVLSALMDNGIAGVQVNVFSWLEDVELRNPTLTMFTMTPQGLLDFGFMDHEKAAKRLTSGGIRGDDAITDDAITKRVKTIGAYVRTYGGFITDSVAVLSIVGKLAMFAGFSKPASEGQSTFVGIRANPCSHMMIGPSPAIRMATIAAQKVVLPPKTFGSADDELDIKRFVSRQGLMRRIAWTTANASGTVLADWYVTPCNGHATVGSFFHSPLSFVASMFQLWRGTIELELLTSKTKLQSGQLEVIWQLGTAKEAITLDSETANCYRVIWDIQENSSIKLVFPFCSPLKWNQIFVNDDLTPTVPPVYNVNHTNGAIIVRVLNPLVNADATVASSVDILVLVNGGSDIEFAVPVAQRAFAGFQVSPSPYDPKGKEEERGEAQGGDIFQSQVEDRETPPVVLTKSSPHTSYGSVTCIGECVPNMRMLLRRMLPITSAGLLSRRTYSGLSTAMFYIDHRFATQGHFNLNQLMYAFAFFSGGIRYHIHSHWGPWIMSTGTSYLNRVTLQTTFGFVSGIPYVPPNPAYTFLNEASPDVTLDIPYQSVVPFMPMGSIDSPTQTGPPVKLKCDWFAFINNGVAVVDFEELIGTADDFTMGWQIGVPTANYYAGYYGVDYSWNGYTA